MKKINLKLTLKKGDWNLTDIIYNVILFLLIFAGLCLVFWPGIQKVMLRSSISKYNIRSFSTSELLQNQTTSEFEYSQENLQIPDVESVVLNLGQAKRGDVLAGIYIPSVNIDLPILNGISQANLLAGVGTMKEGQVMGEGNYALAGHHMKDPSLLFGPLSKISVGDLIYLTDHQDLYTYRTDSIKIVHQTQVDVLEDGETATVTLITCNISGINTNQRLVITGELVGKDRLVNEDSEAVSLASSEVSRSEQITAEEEELRRNEFVESFLLYQEETAAIRTVSSAPYFLLFAAISLLIVWLCQFILKRA